MELIERLDEKVVNCILALTKEKWAAGELKKQFVNPLLREDVLDLLDKYCTVIYYPLEEEKDNNGFHIREIPDKKGNAMEFIFINTAQSTEKQIFTAAHELGHIWDIDKLVIEKLGYKADTELEEKIINRFAAELLMPKAEFMQAYSRERKLYPKNDNKISVVNMLHIIAALMNEFFVPYKSVVRRLYEAERISLNVADFLLGNQPERVKLDVILAKIREIIKADGYVKLLETSSKKWIDGLAELLEKAEAQGSVSKDKIKKMREEFGLEATTQNKALEKNLTLESGGVNENED